MGTPAGPASSSGTSRPTASVTAHSTSTLQVTSGHPHGCDRRHPPWERQRRVRDPRPLRAKSPPVLQVGSDAKRQSRSAPEIKGPGPRRVGALRHRATAAASGRPPVSARRDGAATCIGHRARDAALRVGLADRSGAARAGHDTRVAHPSLVRAQDDAPSLPEWPLSLVGGGERSQRGNSERGVGLLAWSICGRGVIVRRQDRRPDRARSPLGAGGAPLSSRPLWFWRARRDSNPRPSGPQPDALSTELRAHAMDRLRSWRRGRDSNPRSRLPHLAV